MPPASDRITKFLHKKFPGNKIAPAHYGELLTQYAHSSIRPPHLLTELETEDEGKFWSAIWEAMLYRHFSGQGFK